MRTRRVGRAGIHLAAFLVYGCDVWGRQIPIMWDLVREAISVRRLIQEQLSEDEITGIVLARSEEYKIASLEFAATFAEWQEYHAVTVEIHDPIFARSVGGLFEWAGSLGPRVTSWMINAIIKDEMYRELASTVLALRGMPTTVTLPVM